MLLLSKLSHSHAQTVYELPCTVNMHIQPYALMHNVITDTRLRLTHSVATLIDPELKNRIHYMTLYPTTLRGACTGPSIACSMLSLPGHASPHQFGSFSPLNLPEQSAQAQHFPDAPRRIHFAMCPSGVVWLGPHRDSASHGNRLCLPAYLQLHAVLANSTHTKISDNLTPPAAGLYGQWKQLATYSISHLRTPQRRFSE